MRKKSRSVVTMILALVIAFAMMPMTGAWEACAEGPEHPKVVKDGGSSNFASGAPIATVTIDTSKITKDNLVLNEYDQLDQWVDPNKNAIFTLDNGYVYLVNGTRNNDTGECTPENGDIVVHGGYNQFGNFSLVYRDAAIMRDGTRKNLEVTFDIINVITNSSSEVYADKIRLAYAGDAQNPLAWAPLSVKKPNNYYAFRSEIKFRIGEGGEVSDSDETFFFTAGNIKCVRSIDFDIINNSYGNYHYSDSVEPMYGINDQSDIYLPSATKLTENAGLNLTSGSYGFRFIRDPNSALEQDEEPLNLGLASVVRAGGTAGQRTDNGFITRVWGSSGPGGEASNISFMNADITWAYTSASGDGGRIELWTDGQVDSETAACLPGGTSDKPYTYAVPGGKTVTYKMTPDANCSLGEVKVNGVAVEPDAKYDGDGAVDHYEYSFAPADQDQKIAVTWKKPQTAPKVSGTLVAKATAKGKKGLTVKWTKVNGAAGYDIFFAKCNHSSKKDKCKYAATIKGSKTLSWTKNGLKKKTAYKAYVKAYVIQDGKKKYVRTSPVIHAFTTGYNKTYTNAKSVKVNKSKVTLGAGKTFKIKATVKKLKSGKKLMSKGHAPKLRYLTSNSKVADVNSKGKIKAKAKGTCYVYAIAHNGVSKTITVTVK